MKEDFVLPEKWTVVVYSNYQFHRVREFLSYMNGCNFGKNCHSTHRIKEDGSPYYIGYRLDGTFFYNCNFYECQHAHLITFDQFNVYVLGMEEKQQQKEIVGWKLKEEFKEYENPIALMCDKHTPYWWIDNANNNVSKYGYNFVESKMQGTIAGILKQAGVLDLWFTPVYANETPQIIINGYKGEFLKTT